MAAPNHLFKFTPRIQFLENGLFRFTQPSALNDPQEALPGLSVNQYASEDIAAARASAASRGMSELDDERLRALFLRPFPHRRFDEQTFRALWPATEKRLREEPFDTIAEYDEALARRAVELVAKAADSSIGIFSLSSVNSPAMWAYYADDSRGACIEFDPQHPFFGLGLRPVLYSDNPISVSTNDGWLRLAGEPLRSSDVLNGDVRSVPLDLFFRKRTDWRHESEWRMLRFLDQADEIRTTNDGVAVHLFRIPPEAVTKVTLGFRVPDQVVEDVSRRAARAPWQHVRIERMRRWPAGMAIEVVS